jgi:hypothetical protein
MDVINSFLAACIQAGTITSRVSHRACCIFVRGPMSPMALAETAAWYACSKVATCSNRAVEAVSTIPLVQGP